MPCSNASDLPKYVRNNLPDHGRAIYRKAFNIACDQYDEEERAHNVVWFTVRNVYEKKNGEWEEKD